jgi:inner membrane transporter RhtA
MVALRTLPAGVFGVLMALEPAVAALAGFVVLSQALGTIEVLAIGLVVAAAVGTTLGARSHVDLEPEAPVPVASVSGP